MTTVTTSAPAAAQARPAAGHHAAGGKSAAAAPASPADAFSELLAAMADAGGDATAVLGADTGDAQGAQGDAAAGGDAKAVPLGADAAAAATPMAAVPTAPAAWIAAMLPSTVAKADARVAAASNAAKDDAAEGVGAACGTASRGARDLPHGITADDRAGAHPGPAAAAASHPHAAVLAAAAQEKGAERPRDETPAIANLTAAPALPHAHGAEAANAMRLPADSPVKAEVHQAALPSHPLDAAFAGDVAAEVKLMADGGLNQAELRLNPAELGPVHIRLELQANTADVQFTAAHATTREGLSQALPQLRELLAGQGLQLGQAGVGAGTGQGSDASAWQAQREAARSLQRDVTGGDAGQAASPAVTVTRRIQAGRGMLDLYA